MIGKLIIPYPDHTAKMTVSRQFSIILHHNSGKQSKQKNQQKSLKNAQLRDIATCCLQL
jgi:hypothetical protein